MIQPGNRKGSTRGYPPSSVFEVLRLFKKEKVRIGNYAEYVGATLDTNPTRILKDGGGGRPKQISSFMGLETHVLNRKIDTDMYMTTHVIVLESSESTEKTFSRDRVTRFELTAFLDSGSRGCLDSRKSSSGGIQFIAAKLIKEDQSDVQSQGDDAR
ncbi:hypothetical protein Tco_1274164 [Tanacetum coccineum]